MVRDRVRIRDSLGNMVVELYECWDKVIIRVMVRVELGLPRVWDGVSVGGVR